MRVFEAMGAGSLLLTDKVDSLDELFQDGVHLVTYSSLDEAVDKAKFYLKNDSLREKIALSGYKEVMDKHTIDHRLDVILNEINKEGKDG